MPLTRKPPPAPPAGTGPLADAAAIARALAEGNEDERWAAARAAANLPDSVPALKDALAGEPSPAVREALFSALARIASPQSAEAVLPLLRSDDALLRTRASDALVAMKQAAWPFIAVLLRDESADVRVLACGMLREMPSERAAPLCCELLDAEPEQNVCAAAVETLAELGDASALPALMRCAQRFRGTPFLEFSIDTAIDRVRSQATTPRA
jgi:HEAT repeat protein